MCGVCLTDFWFNWFNVSDGLRCWIACGFVVSCLRLVWCFGWLYLIYLVAVSGFWHSFNGWLGAMRCLWVVCFGF